MSFNKTNSFIWTQNLPFVLWNSLLSLPLEYRSCLQAHRLDQPDHSSNPYTSSLLEDVFYVLRSVLSRVLLTSSTSTVSSMIRVIRTTIDEEFVGVLVRRMDAIGRSAQSVMAVDGPRKENASREMRSVFVVSMIDKPNRRITKLHALGIDSQSCFPFFPVPPFRLSDLSQRFAHVIKLHV